MSINARGNNWSGDLEDRNVVGLRDDGLHEFDVEGGAIDGRAESDLTLTDQADLDEAHLAIGGTGGLVESGQLSLLVLNGGHELHLVVVVEDDMSAEDGLDGGWWLAGEGGDAGVVDGEDGDGLTAIDLISKLGFGKVLIE